MITRAQDWSRQADDKALDRTQDLPSAMVTSASTINGQEKEAPKDEDKNAGVSSESIIGEDDGSTSGPGDVIKEMDAPRVASGEANKKRKREARQDDQIEAPSKFSKLDNGSKQKPDHLPKATPPALPCSCLPGLCLCASAASDPGTPDSGYGSSKAGSQGNGHVSDNEASPLDATSSSPMIQSSTISTSNENLDTVSANPLAMQPPIDPNGEEEEEEL